MIETALASLHALADPEEAARAAAYHKAQRTYLGIRVPELTELAKSWRAGLDTPGRVALAEALWQSDIHEARVAAAKLLTQARIRDDGPVWDLIAGWIPDLDAWALADHLCDAGARRLIADPARLDQVATWTGHENMWTRRAALVITLPWAKMPFPKAADLAIRERVLDWAVTLAPDRDWFIQKAIATWLRDLSKRDPERCRSFLAEHGVALKSFARKEAGRLLEDLPSTAPETNPEQPEK
ncbi:DNA alkylation repair protein [Thioclava sp. BHET1]|nr:DNA alkylation repair protein [Thioclava sp. BHET1]